MSFIVSRLFGPATYQPLPLPPPGPHLFDKFVKQEAATPFIDNLSRADLLQLQHIIKVSRKEDSPLAAKVNTAYNRVRGEPISLDEELTPLPQDSDPAFVNQGLETLDAMIKKIASEGASWTKLSLNTVTDEILEIVSTTCTNLETLVLDSRLDNWYQLETELTDKGITALTKLTNLKEFTFKGWAVSVSEVSFFNLLTNPEIQSKLTSLNLYTLIFGDSLIPVLNKLPALQNLELHTCGITTAAMATLSLPSTIKTLNVTQSTGMLIPVIDDTVLKQFSNFTSLESLTLGGLMNCSEAGVIGLIVKLPNLKKLSWGTFAMTDKIAAALPPQLTHLALGNCSQISNQGFGGLIPTLTSLVSLQLQKSNGFAAFQPPISGIVNNTTQLPKTLKNLYLHTSWISSYAGLPPVTSLTLQGAGEINPSAFSNELGKLPLKTLRIINCDTFTDQQLRHLSNTPLVHTLANLQIVKAPLTGASVQSLERFPKLKALMLGKVGFDEEGASAFFNSSILSKRITHLFLNCFVITPQLKAILERWPNLEVLFLGNTLELPFDQGNFKVVNLEQKNGMMSTWAGEGWTAGDTFGAFLHPFGEQ